MQNLSDFHLNGGGSEITPHDSAFLASLSVLDQPYMPESSFRAPVDPKQTLDLYVPPGEGPFPLIIWIHGGGWHSCDKSTDAAPQFLEAGFALASVDYRLTSSGAPFPAQIEDCFSALDWLRRNGAKYKLDTQRIGLLGHSAGAHLAALIVTTAGTGLFSDIASPPVQAAVLWSGPFDLGRERGHWPSDTFVWNPEDPFCKTFFPSGTYDDAFARSASPASYIRAGLPPMLLVHGGKDGMVPPGQALAFAEALRGRGVNAQIRMEPESGHETMSPENYLEARRFFKGVL